MIADLALTEAVKARALALGFDLVAVGPAAPPEHGESFARWVEAGHAGTMGYLARRLPERLDPARVLPEARSVVCVALNYYQGVPDEPSWAPVARYAWGRDYHDVMTPRLDALARFIERPRGSAEGATWTPAPFSSVTSPRERASAGSARTPC
jgi:epoxyqueuosine reductase